MRNFKTNILPLPGLCFFKITDTSCGLFVLKQSWVVSNFFMSPKCIQVDTTKNKLTIVRNMSVLFNADENSQQHKSTDTWRCQKEKKSLRELAWRHAAAVWMKTSRQGHSCLVRAHNSAQPPFVFIQIEVHTSALLTKALSVGAGNNGKKRGTIHCFHRVGF